MANQQQSPKSPQQPLPPQQPPPVPDKHIPPLPLTNEAREAPTPVPHFGNAGSGTQSPLNPAGNTTSPRINAPLEVAPAGNSIPPPNTGEALNLPGDDPIIDG